MTRSVVTEAPGGSVAMLKLVFGPRTSVAQPERKDAAMLAINSPRIVVRERLYLKDDLSDIACSKALFVGAFDEKRVHNNPRICMTPIRTLHSRVLRTTLNFEAFFLGC